MRGLHKSALRSNASTTTATYMIPSYLGVFHPSALRARDIVPARTLEVGGTEAIKQVVAASVRVAIVSAAAVKD